MANFKSVLKAFRVVFKPGMGRLTSPAQQGFAPAYPKYENTSNGDAVCDWGGSQWVRDAQAPMAFLDEDQNGGGLYGWIYGANDFATEGVAVRQARANFINAGVGVVGSNPDDDDLSLPTALYAVDVTAGDAAVPWAGAPVYLHIFSQLALGIRPSVNNLPALGDVPQYVAPVPIPPERLFVEFGENRPFNSVFAKTGGIALGLSSTRDTFTPGPTGVINANYTLYSYKN